MQSQQPPRYAPHAPSPTFGNRSLTSADPMCRPLTNERSPRGLTSFAFMREARDRMMPRLPDYPLKSDAGGWRRGGHPIPSWPPFETAVRIRWSGGTGPAERRVTAETSAKEFDWGTTGHASRHRLGAAVAGGDARDGQ